MKSHLKASKVSPAEAAQEARERLFARVKEGRISFSIPPSRLPANITPRASLSTDVKDLIRRLVCVDVDQRMAAAQVLHDGWLMGTP